MEIIPILIMTILLNYMLYNSSKKSESNITKINDENWIVGSELVSFEEDTPLLRFQQQCEDEKHFRNYETDKLMKDRGQIFDDHLKTIQAIHKNPELKNCVTDEKLKAITEKHEEYILMCDKLGETIRQTKEQFLIKQENPWCCSSMGFQGFRKSLGVYEIHNDKTAKYLNGNMEELMEKEFKAKWY